MFPHNSGIHELRIFEGRLEKFILSFYNIPIASVNTFLGWVNGKLNTANPPLLTLDKDENGVLVVRSQHPKPLSIIMTDKLGQVLGFPDKQTRYYRITVGAGNTYVRSNTKIDTAKFVPPFFMVYLNFIEPVMLSGVFESVLKIVPVDSSKIVNMEYQLHEFKKLNTGRYQTRF